MIDYAESDIALWKSTTKWPSKCITRIALVLFLWWLGRCVLQDFAMSLSSTHPISVCAWQVLCAVHCRRYSSALDGFDCVNATRLVCAPEPNLRHVTQTSPALYRPPRHAHHQGRPSNITHVALGAIHARKYTHTRPYIDMWTRLKHSFEVQISPLSSQEPCFCANKYSFLNLLQTCGQRWLLLWWRNYLQDVSLQYYQ